MELMDLVLIVAVNGVVSLMFSLIFALAVAYLRENGLNRRMKSLEDDFDSLVDSINGKQGQEIKKENAALVENAEAEIAAILANPEIADKKAALMAIAPKYLSILPLLMKKYSKFLK